MIRIKVFIIILPLLLSACMHKELKTQSCAGEALMKIYKYDGSVQCDNSSGIKLHDMEQHLVEAGIDVMCSQQGNDGLLRAMACGMGTGRINIYTINPANLNDAKALGFESLSALPDYTLSN